MSSVGENRERLCDDDGSQGRSSSRRRISPEGDYTTDVQFAPPRRRRLDGDRYVRPPYGCCEDSEGRIVCEKDLDCSPFDNESVSGGFDGASTCGYEEMSVDMGSEKCRSCSLTKAAWEKRRDVTNVGHLLHYAGKGDVENVRRLLDGGADIDGVDYDRRTALHIAASDGQYEIAKLLLERGAHVNPMDRWNMTPLAEAIQFNKGDALCQLLREYNGKVPKALGKRITSGTGLVNLVDDNSGGPDDSSIPEWEIDNTELDFHNSKTIGRGAFGQVQIAVWRGTRVAVKKILRSLEQDQHTIRDFQEEVSLLPLLRHPNIVQFMGAVTLNPPLMLVTEYLPKGDLYEMLSQEKRLSVPQVLRYALDIARGMNYLHSHKPEAIVHRDLKPRNLLLGDGGHLKVADFGLSKLLHQGVEKYQMTGETGSYRYMAPEVYRHECYDKMVDVFSFAVIVYEMFEGEGPFRNLPADEAARCMSRGERPKFQATTYTPGMKELISQCWHANPRERPPFSKIINILEVMEVRLEDNLSV